MASCRFTAPAQAARDAELAGMEKNEILRAFMPVRFLIADDFSAHQKLMSNIIRFLGGESIFASNGYEALQLAQREECDIVLMDLQMPGLGGVAATDQLIQGWPSDQRHPSIIAVTGDNSLERRALCRAIGMNGFIAKPYDANTLNDALQQVIIRGHCWTDSPPCRLFNMTRFLEVVENGAELRRLEFEDWAGSMPDALSDLFDSINASGADANRPRIEELRSDAATMGFIRLEAILRDVRHDTTKLKASWLDSVLDDFDLCLMAARNSIQLASESLMDCV